MTKRRNEVKSWPGTINQAQFIEDTHRLYTYQLADKYQCNERHIRRLKLYLREHGFELGAGRMPLAPGPKYNQEFQIVCDRALLFSDSEVPDHDAELFDMMISIRRRWNLEKLIGGGDFIRMDSFTPWPPMSRPAADYRDELEPSREILSAFLKEFDEICLINANHEQRYQRFTQGHRSFGDDISDLFGVQFSLYAHGYLYSAGEKIRFSHPTKGGSDIPLSWPRKAVAKYHCNVAIAHTHHHCFGWDASDTYWMIETGHCRDVERTAYKQLNETSHSQWNAGFTMIIDGFPYLVNKRNFMFWMGAAPDKDDDGLIVGSKESDKRRGKPQRKRASDEGKNR